MGFRFKKSFKILPWLKINTGKRGLGSVSLGGRGASLNLGRKTRRVTVGLPGTGLSYTKASSTKRQRSKGKYGWIKWVIFMILLIVAVRFIV